MNKILMYDQYDETYREVIDVKELREYILKKIEEYDETLYYAETEEGMAELKDYEYDEAKYGKKVLQSFLKDLEVEDD